MTREPAHHPDPVSIPELVERCMGSTALATTLLEKFETQLRADIVEIEKRLAEDDAAQLARIAHALKGAAGAVGASGLHETAADAELCARENRVGELAGAVHELRREADRCLARLPGARRDLLRG